MEESFFVCVSSSPILHFKRLITEIGRAQQTFAEITSIILYTEHTKNNYLLNEKKYFINFKGL